MSGVSIIILLSHIVYCVNIAAVSLMCTLRTAGVHIVKLHTIILTSDLYASIIVLYNTLT